MNEFRELVKENENTKVYIMVGKLRKSFIFQTFFTQLTHFKPMFSF